MQRGLKAPPLVAHLLPHPGGGGEEYVDLLTADPRHAHERAYLSGDARPTSLVLGSPRRLPVARRLIARADLVHVHGDMASVLALPVLHSRRWVWTTHGLHFRRRCESRALALAFDQGLRKVLKSAAVTICTSRAERDELLAIDAGAPGPLEVVHNAVLATDGRQEAAAESLRREFSIGEDEMIVVFLAALESHKGALDAIAAVASARAAGAPVVLVVAGAGSQDEHVRQAAGLGVHVVGQRKAAPLLAGADAFVLPSAREGLSLALLAAMEHGLACVVSDGPGNPEAVADSGIVVPHGDVEALASALGRLARDPAERQRLGASARVRAHESFGVPRLLEQTGAVYDRALMGLAPGGGAAHA